MREDGKGSSEEVSDGKEEPVTGNWRKGVPHDKAAKLPPLPRDWCLCPSVSRKAELPQ